MEGNTSVTKPVVSVIVPVYNLEKYIAQCVDSILTSADKVEMEVILVDDGSKDSSAAVCDKLAQQYSQVRVIHKPNGGAADSRNTGICAARGDYLMFVDGDDFLPEGAVAAIMEKIEPNIDIFTFGYYEYYGENDCRPMLHFDAARLNGKNAFAEISPLPMPWLYAIDRKYVVENEILMHKGLLDEDEEWTARLFALEPRVKTLEGHYYYYRRNRENSLTFNRKYKNAVADIEIIKLLLQEMQKSKYTANGRQVLENKCRQMLDKVAQDIDNASPEERRKLRKLQKPYRALMRKGDRRYQFFYIADPLLGRGRAHRLLVAMAKLKNKLR